MIFDFVLNRSSPKASPRFPGPELGTTGSLPSVYQRLAAKPFSHRGRTWEAWGLGRSGYEECLSVSDQLSIFVVGECYSRIDSAYFNRPSRRVTAEELRRLFLERGESMVGQIKGNFQVVVCDDRDNSVRVFNSRGGVSPFYYRAKGNEFIIATAMYLFPEAIREKLAFSTAHILEYALFNYPLGEHTLFDDASNLLPGQILTFRDGAVGTREYFDVRDSLTERRISADEAIERGEAIFASVVQTLAGEENNVALSLTGGFDGRAILSALRFDPSRILLYAFGIEGSQNITIPAKIAKERGYNFRPYYLDDTYARAYPEYASATCLVTDCLATVQRANYLYVFEDLSKHSDVVLTGLFGSELMRTFQNAGLMISGPAATALMAKDPVSRLRREIMDYPYRSLWGENVFTKENEECVIETFRENYLSRSYSSLNQRIFTYFISDALRKYFGGEVHAERVFATNRFPFFDDEFVELILQSPFSAVNTTFLKPTINERITSQLYYAHLIKKNMPGLLRYTTDHGFAPKFLFYPFAPLFVGPQVVLDRMLKKWGGYKEFNSVEWAARQFKERSDVFEKSSLINMTKIRSLVDRNEWRPHVAEIRKAFSLQLYSNFLGK